MGSLSLGNPFLRVKMSRALPLLLKVLPIVLPLVVRWAESEERRILQHGQPLSKTNLRDAVQMGVTHPEKIRLLKVKRIPLPRTPILQSLASLTGLFSLDTAGMSLRYGIFIRQDCWGSRHLIAHECVHTGQCERLGGFRPFLKQYLEECLRDGYLESDLEQEAMSRSAEIMD